ncbi:hypothetical protein BATDEDRAFT_21543 [Batrachochytrium dendrobatidis JAM81]|uniref:Uncharacterized protein n=2 Tax=Batrachochytrium dendrobatidis TaxID=109871 RepID=F4NTR8_BATDJ|nr:uncharacterized protein BATDEDRAFT_21543 [Batrachochytrium dendrobatidis JAM81]EGF83128.1 hypothetical protein BATDEDRAFT_21543 [Batrachochytrium dendrobatidis JAM81]OAJ36256.1 hypothetical protein BDEG_20449 [Batrachochytrium dendrobatidis JEL423]|eukprot:XP_006675314.1 hypothetical protein BATDEDRAFT_21543 [Batrachochytrium dendrobatidis JAM81]
MICKHYCAHLVNSLAVEKEVRRTYYTIKTQPRDISIEAENKGDENIYLHFSSISPCFESIQTTTRLLLQHLKSVDHPFVALRLFQVGADCMGGLSKPSCQNKIKRGVLHCIQSKGSATDHANKSDCHRGTRDTSDRCSCHSNQ